MNLKNFKCFICNKSDFIFIEKIDKKPFGETDFGINNEKYLRYIVRCTNCDVFNNFHSYNLDNLYETTYNELTYSNSIKNNYNKILNLPYHKSDNKQRVKRIIEYLTSNNQAINKLDILDVGSGLCVFLGEIKKHGPKVHCIDPSQVSIDHALENVKVDSAYKGNFLSVKNNKKYDLITFNKVLEHVVNPAKMLEKAKSLLKENGRIYIELPNGKEALRKDSVINREEFFLEHYTIFTVESVRFLSKISKLKVERIKEIHEPSDKYTLFSFHS